MVGGDDDEHGEAVPSLRRRGLRSSPLAADERSEAEAVLGVRLPAVAFAVAFGAAAAVVVTSPACNAMRALAKMSEGPPPLPGISASKSTKSF
mmetsp:Transcript_63793/g.180029  ORF Transcript_63793/g.180029 Transcript_63793/m.180029 type:complete len:93 (-) Transcript_63793:624-902(-)